MTLPHIIVPIIFAVILFSRVNGFYPAVGKISTKASDRLYHWGVGGCHQLRQEKKEEKENRWSLLSSSLLLLSLSPSSLSSSSLSSSLSSSISPLNDKNDNEDNNQIKEDKDNNNIHQQIKQKDPIWYKEYVSEIFGNE